MISNRKRGGCKEGADTHDGRDPTAFGVDLLSALLNPIDREVTDHRCGRLQMF
jgi:hypothetical protein